MIRFIKNSSLYLLTTIILNASSFLLLPYYTRLISPDEFGNIYLMQTISTILGMIASIQIQTSITRYYYDYKENTQKLKNMYSSIICYTFLQSTIIYGFVFYMNSKIFWFLEIEFFPYMAFFLISSYLLIFYNLVLSLLYVEEKARVISIISILAGIISIILTIILVNKFDDKIYGFALSKLLSAIFYFILFIYFSKDYFTIKFRMTDIKEYITFSLQRLPTGFSSWLVTFADRFMVYGYIGAYENGLYSTGYKMGQIPDLIYNAINQAYVPYVFNNYTNQNDKNNTKLIEIANYMFTLFIFVIFILIVFSKELIFILDRRYKDSLGIMIIILMAYGLNGIKLIFHCPMDYVKKYGKIKSIIWMSSAVINVILNAILIPKFGVYGAAIATLISYIVTIIPTIYFSNKAIYIKYDYVKMFKVTMISIIYSFLFLFDISILNLIMKIMVTIFYMLVLIKVNDIKICDVKNTIIQMKR
ncbi:O-antigen/teichoic acid export membrane protein [Alkalibaculum bacchi]|uniref:O-antigen/teichoic acid export membrane protein n=1 Tax=Alkalibaculum bacchi TaxID=645887 RepID=A0A366HX48_9FIRM|nr:oligosaccharide flippase family protein [Alkalibaculum bacchi]RBP58085.1 O-antigen/teichoic acid export membrane protein [Alkalibaculum bacchi]